MSQKATELLRASLADNGLDEEALDQFIAARRRQGSSWNNIAFGIYERTGVSMTVPTLINWFPDYNKPAAELVEADS